MAGKKAALINEDLNEGTELLETPEGEATQQAATEGAEPEPIEVAPAPAEKGKKGAEEFVPRSRLNEVIAEREAARQELAQSADIREKWARLEERQNLAREAQQQAQRAEENARLAAQRPDPELDPSGARAWDAEQRAIRLEQQVTQLTQQFQGQAQQTQQSIEQTQLQSWVGGELSRARSTVPDYDARVDFARAKRNEWWGQFYPPEQAKQIVAQEEQLVLNRAREIGMGLGDMVTFLSNQWNYQPANGNGAANGNGNGVRQVVPAQVMPSGNERLTQIKNGQAVQGLGRVQSGESRAQTPWQAMSMDEFKMYVATMSEDEYLTKTQEATGKQFLKKLSMVDNPDLE